MGLKPEITAYLAERSATGLPQVWQAPLAEIRENTKLHIALKQPLLQIYSVDHRSINGPTSNLPIRIYRPSEENNLPALVFFHGGGWVIGDIDTHDTLCRELSDGSGAAVYSVNYAKAPEHQFPAAVDDSLLATRHVIASHAELGIDPARVGTGGDSAGGNLATVVAQALRGTLSHPLALQLLIYPVTDLRLSTPSYQTYAQGYGLTAIAMRHFRDTYLRDEADIADTRASPLLTADLSGMPPALVLTAGFDPLRDEGAAYADALSAAGNPAQYICFERQIHGFIVMGGAVDEANTAVRLCADYLRSRFSSISGS